MSLSTILGGNIFLYGAATDSYIEHFGDGSLGAKKLQKHYNQAKMASSFSIFDDLNNGQLLANLRTLLLDSRATRICNFGFN
jgi:hypothetical protein